MSSPNMTTSSIVVVLHGAHHPVKHRSLAAPAVVGSPTSFRRGLPPVDGPRRVVRSCAVPARRPGAGARSLPPGALARPIPGRRSFSSWRPCCIRRKLWIAFGGSGLRAVQPRLHGTVGPCRRLSPRWFVNVSVDVCSDRQIFASPSRRSLGVVVTLRLRSWPAIATVHRRPVPALPICGVVFCPRSGGRGSQSPSDDRSRRVPSPPSQGVDSRDDGSRELFRGGRRARHRADPERRNAEDRKIDAAELLGVYGVVSRTQVVQASFGGNAFSANRLLKRMESDGFIESRNSGAGRYGYSVLALTPTGVSWLERQRKRRRKSSDRVSDPEQRLVSGFGDGRQLQHDQRVFEAVQADVGQEVSRGSRVKRVRLDPELKGLLASASESARVKGGRLRLGARARLVPGRSVCA